MRPKANNRRKRRKNNLMTFTHPGQDSTRGQKYKFGARLWRKTIGPSALPHAPLSFFPIGYSEEFCFLWPIDDIFATAALFDFTVASLFGVRTRECTRLQIESCPSRFHVDVCFLWTSSESLRELFGRESVVSTSTSFRTLASCYRAVHLQMDASLQR